MVKDCLFRLLVSVVIFLVPFTSFAQEIPPSESSGAEQERFRLEEERRKQEQALFDESQAPELIVPDEALPASLEAGPKFRMNDIRITGNEEISTEEIHRIAGQLLNRDVNLQEIQEVVRQIKQLYRSRGFISTYVYVPPQRVQAGVIELRIVEGQLGKIEITGNRWFSDGVIARRIQAKPGEIIRYDSLKSDMAQINEHRDVKTVAVLKPGTEAGTTDVEVQVEDEFPVHMSADVNNLGTENTGKMRAGVALLHTNLFGQMDQASARFQIGKDVWAVGTDYNIPINANDTKIGFAFQHSSVDLGGPFKALDIEGKATTFYPYLTHPVFRNDRLKVLFQTGFNFKEVENSIRGQEAGKDALRIWDVGFHLDQNDRLGRTFFQPSFHFGFSSFLGASDKTEVSATRPGTGGQFFIYRQTLLRYVSLSGGLGLVLRSALQLSNDPLPPSEQFRLGGAFSVRGYPEAEYLADYGGTGSAELYVPTYFFPKDWILPFAQYPLRQQIKGTAFFDFGVGQNRRTLPGEKGHRTLAGAGLGVRVHLYDRVFARLEWAFPTGSTPEDHSNSNFYFGVSAEFF